MMRNLICGGLALASLTSFAYGENVIDCAASSTVHYKIIFNRGWGFNDCHAVMSFSALAVEGKNPPGMTCDAAIPQGKAFEKNCSGSGMKLHIMYAKK